MPDDATEPEVQRTPRPMPAGGMVSPLVPGLSVLGIEGMIGAVCDPNDPDSCEISPELLAQLTADNATSTAEDAR